ncbi:MAG: transglycosylase domain-containing protein [Chloroflexota bacterium]
MRRPGVDGSTDAERGGQMIAPTRPAARPGQRAVPPARPRANTPPPSEASPYRRRPGKWRQPQDAGVLPYPPFRRTGKRRVEQPRRHHRPVELIVALHLVVGTLLLVGACTALPAGGALALLQARYWMSEHTIDLPRDGPLDRDIPQTARIISRDGSVLAEIDDVRYGRRTYVPLNEMSKDLVNATMATEDRRFFTHNGVDPVGLARAFSSNAEAGGVAQGGSTIEMQLTRNLFLSDEKTERTLARKLKEALAAVELDKRYSKDELLEAYLNIVFYGNRAFGAEAASQEYFGKSARDLTLPEASLLAGLPQSPVNYDPLQHFDAAKARQKAVLARMVDVNLIGAEEAYQALSAPLLFKRPEPVPVRAPHWVNYVRDVARSRFGPEELYTGGLRIRTTIDMEIQQLAEQIVARGDDVRAAAHANNSAMVVIEPSTGQVLAMVGSKDFDDVSIAGQVNVATSVRQPGSSIKPLVMLAGYERGLNPATEVQDQPTAFSAPPGQPAYRPENYETKYYGRVSLRDALGNSLNVPAVKVLKWVGVANFQELARRFGISTLDSWDPRWLSLTLGGGEVRLLEMTGAYATLAREGNYVPVEPFLDVTTTRNEVLYETKNGLDGTQVADPKRVYQLLSVMGDPGARMVTFGPNTPLNLPRPHMVKTGTTDDYRDTWTIGCVPQVCVGVWMGNTNNDPMVKVSSSLTAGRMWVEMIQTLIERKHWTPDPWPQPEGVVFRQITGGGIRGPYATYYEVFLDGHEERMLLDMDWMRPD